MMKNRNNRLLLLFILPLLLSLACNFALDLPFLGSQDEGISPEDVSLAATRAAEAAATAAAVAGEAGQLAATAVVQSQELAATTIPSAEKITETALPTAEASVTGTSIERKLANIQPDADGNFSVSITEDDLNEFVAGQEGGIQTEALSAQDIGFDITPEHLELSADVTEPVQLPLIIQLRPTVTGDQLRFELLSASAGLFPVPEGMLDVIETVANTELTRALIGLPSGTTLNDATLGEGEFTIYGHQN